MEGGYEYLFPYEKVPYNSKIVIYGAGILGQEYLKQMMITKYCDIVAFIDKNFDKYAMMKVPVYSPKQITSLNFDKVVIALRNDHALREVMRVLIENRVNPTDIVCVHQRDTSICKTVFKTKYNEKNDRFAFGRGGIAIALYMIGGFGDAIIQKKFVETIVNLLPKCRVDIYSINASKYLSHIYFLCHNINLLIDDAGGLYNKLREKYALGITLRGHSLELNNYDKKALEDNNYDLSKRIVQLKSICKKENLQINVPSYIRFMRCIYKGYNCYTGYSYDGVFTIDDYKVDIPLRQNVMSVFSKMNLSAYITINCGNGDSKDVRLVAKSWPLDRFEKFISLFKDKYPKISIVQVGSEDSKSLLGIDKYVLGENLEVVKYVLKGAIFHLDIEGGLVHLATQLGTKCIVLFGPTSDKYFGYKDNINIKAGKCHGCYGIYTDINCCARNMDKPECMYSITPEMVMKEVEMYFNKNSLSYM